MTRKFVVLVDGSDCSENCVALAAQRTNRLDSFEDALIICHVFVDSEQAGLPLNQRADTIKRKYEGLLSSHKLVYDRSSPVPLRYDVQTVAVEQKSHIVSGISNFINDNKPDVVVLGFLGMGRKENINGSVISHILQSCPCSLIVKHFRTIPGPEDAAKVLITTDGSPVSEQAIDIGCKLLRPNDVVKIITLSGNRGPRDESVLEKAQEIAKKRQVNAENLEIKFVARDTSVSVGKQLCALVDELDTDFLVMGSVGIGSAVSLGSVAKFVLKNSRSHVMVVRDT